MPARRPALRRLAAGPALAAAVVLAVLAVLAAAGGVRAAKAPTYLGPPDEGGYCRSIGQQPVFTAETPKQWGCQSPSGTVTLMNMQAACEFSYPQRPISAVELLPGALYTWQCQPGTSGSAPGGTPEAQLRSALAGTLAPAGTAARIALLLRSGYSYRVTVPTTGRLAIAWYYLPKGARLARSRPRPTLVASGSASFARKGSGTVHLTLTRRGRQLLRRARRLSLTARATFTPAIGAATSVTRRITLSR